MYELVGTPTYERIGSSVYIHTQKLPGVPDLVAIRSFGCTVLKMADIDPLINNFCRVVFTDTSMDVVFDMLCNIEGVVSASRVFQLLRHKFINVGQILDCLVESIDEDSPGDVPSELAFVADDAIIYDATTESLDFIYENNGMFDNVDNFRVFFKETVHREANINLDRSRYVTFSSDTSVGGALRFRVRFSGPDMTFKDISDVQRIYEMSRYGLHFHAILLEKVFDKINTR